MHGHPNFISVFVCLSLCTSVQLFWHRYQYMVRIMMQLVICVESPIVPFLLQYHEQKKNDSKVQCIKSKFHGYRLRNSVIVMTFFPLYFSMKVASRLKRSATALSSYLFIYLFIINFIVSNTKSCLSNSCLEKQSIFSDFLKLWLLV